MVPHWLAILFAGRLQSVPNRAYCVAVYAVFVSEDIYAMNAVPATPLATLSTLTTVASHAIPGAMPAM